MRVYLFTFLLFAVAAAEESDEEKPLFVFDDDEKPVRLDYNGTSTPSEFESVKSDVKFYLNSRASTIEYELFVDDLESLKKSFFNPNLETKFVTHGWVNSKRSKACTSVRDAFLKRGNFNVIVVDWSKITLGLYTKAASKVPNVGKRVAKMIDFLANNGMNLNTTTLVGHSLGAHVVGLAGYYAKGKVNYVVGLDPALPLFLFKKPGRRISTADANHVEIIHSNAGKLGYLEPIGTADFYPNGGKEQPGCVVDPGGSCSHARSHAFFAESLVSEVGFYGRQCSRSTKIVPEVCDGELGKMGGLKNGLPYKGSYYVPTKDKPPFALGKIDTFYNVI